MISILLAFAIIYFFFCSNSLFFANLFHLLVLITGITCIVLVIWYANKKQKIEEKFLIALIVLAGFFVYELVDYDPEFGRWRHGPVKCCADDNPSHDENVRGYDEFNFFKKKNNVDS